MKTFKRTFEKKTLPIVEDLKRQLLRHYDAILIDKIRRDAITLHKLYEAECNGCLRDKFSWESWKEYDLARDEQMKWVEQRVTKLESRILKNAREAGLFVYFQGDPRGCPVYLSNEQIPSDSYHSRAVPVPTI